jgi:hypothetical protein
MWASMVAAKLDSVVVMTTCHGCIATSGTEHIEVRNGHSLAERCTSGRATLACVLAAFLGTQAQVSLAQSGATAVLSGSDVCL